MDVNFESQRPNLMDVRASVQPEYTILKDSSTRLKVY